MDNEEVRQGFRDLEELLVPNDEEIYEISAVSYTIFENKIQSQGVGNLELLVKVDSLLSIMVGESGFLFISKRLI